MSDHKPERVYVGTGFHWGLATLLALITLVAVLAAQNTHSVRVEFLFLEGDVPLFVLILVTAIVAIVLTEVAGWLWRRSRRRLLSAREELERLRSPAGKEPMPEPEPETFPQNDAGELPEA
jgi:uncharacterized integral membrane protein